MNDDFTYYYLVWWVEDGSPPEEQLMGIHPTKESAESLRGKIEDHKLPSDKLYITEEKIDKEGACF